LKELEDRISNTAKAAADGDAAHDGSWPDILADLDSPTEIKVEQDGKRFLLRSAPRAAASLALRAAGVALSQTVRQLADPGPRSISRNVVSRCFSSVDSHI
jgi:hypothetical protein